MNKARQKELEKSNRDRGEKKKEERVNEIKRKNERNANCGRRRKKKEEKMVSSSRGSSEETVKNKRYHGFF